MEAGGLLKVLDDSRNTRKLRSCRFGRIQTSFRELKLKAENRLRSEAAETETSSVATEGWEFCTMAPPLKQRRSASSPAASGRLITLATARRSIHHWKHFPLPEKDRSRRPITLMSSFSLKSLLPDGNHQEDDSSLF